MSGASTEASVRAPHPRLREFVGDYVGYDISGARAGTHLGLPSGSLTFIVSIGAPLERLDPGTGTVDAFHVLLAGLHLRPTLIRHDGSMTGIQINFTPLASRVLFDLPPAELAHRTYDLDLISGPVAAQLHYRVNAAATWAARFDAIDDVLTAVFHSDADLPRPEVLESWGLIARTRGRLPVSLVADHIGWSRRHLNAQFQAEYGLGPKEAARVLRFDRARRMLAGRSSTAADVAATCGFADQAHLNREFRAFTGVAPSRWLADDDLARVSLGGDYE